MGNPFKKTTVECEYDHRTGKAILHNPPPTGTHRVSPLRAIKELAEHIKTGK